MNEINKELLLKNFGEHLQKLRVQKNLSLRVLEQLSGVDHSQIHKIEKGITAPSLVTLRALANGLKISLIEIVNFE